MSYRFKEMREKAGLTTTALARHLGVSQAAVSQWDTGKKFPSSEMLCKLADLYCVSIDYLLNREIVSAALPVQDAPVPTETLPFMHGTPVWAEKRGWGIVNAVLDYVIFMDGSKNVLAQAMNLHALPPAFSMGYSPTAKPIPHENLKNYQSLWIQPISPDSFLRDELTGWYAVREFYVENEYGARFLFDTYGTKWLAFEMEL